jgi:hypothetical protein
MEVWVTGYNFESWPFKDHSCHVCFKLAYWFQRNFFFNFPIGSYVKTMSAEGGDLGWRSGSQDIILKVDHLRTIHAMFALNWLTGFRGSYVKTKSSHDGHLEIPIGKRFTSLVQDHPMIIHAKSQFNWLGGFWQEDFKISITYDYLNNFPYKKNLIFFVTYRTDYIVIYLLLFHGWLSPF